LLFGRRPAPDRVAAQRPRFYENDAVRKKPYAARGMENPSTEEGAGIQVTTDQFPPFDIDVQNLSALGEFTHIAPDEGSLD
jgi:hypothetical protein